MRALWDFPGGLELPDHSSAATARPLADAGLPPALIIPVHARPEHSVTVTVAPGDPILGGDRLAEPTDTLSVPVHASTSGTVVAVEQRPVPHPSGLPASCVVIEPDSADRWREPLAPLDPVTIAPATLAERARDCGIVGLGGASFPTHAKLDAPDEQPLASLIINGAECESWIASDEMLMRERAEAVIQGTQLTATVLEPGETVIAVEEDKEAALSALTQARDTLRAEGIEIVPVPARYPVGGEKQLIQVLTGREVPSGDIPPSIGIVCLNVATVAALDQAVRQGQPTTRRLVTVTGDGVRYPRVFDARIGTPFDELAHQAGGYTEGVERLIVGGPMMGFSVATDTVPVDKGTNCILAGTRALFPPAEPALPCIRCSACSDACPASLLPQQLYWYAAADELEQAEQHDLFDCIECGICAEVCPSHIPLVDYFRYAKDTVRARDAERQAADRARQRFQARRERLAREAADKRARREAKKAALKGQSNQAEDRKHAVQDALARARQRRGGNDHNQDGDG